MASNREELRRAFVLANEFKEGDLALGGTRDGAVRAAARAALGAVTLGELQATALVEDGVSEALDAATDKRLAAEVSGMTVAGLRNVLDRKSTRLNSSHANISYAVFCLKKK